MQKILTVLFFVGLANIVFSQNVVATHTITKEAAPNEYTLKTTITGLDGVDIARITYYIPKEHTYKPAASNGLFSNRDEKFIKFYIMAIPANGTINVDLGVVLSSEGRFDFPVEFQYSKNEEKQVINFDPIIIENGSASLAVVEEKTPEASNSNETKEEETTTEEEEPTVDEEVDETAAKKAQEAAELAAKEEAERLAAEKEKEEEAALQQALADKQAEEEKEAKENETKRSVSPTSSNTTAGGTKYAVQIFALSKYSKEKVAKFCAQNNIDVNQISTEVIQGITKIRYGSVGSRSEAETLRKMLLNKPKINGAFIVTLPK